MIFQGRRSFLQLRQVVPDTFSGGHARCVSCQSLHVRLTRCNKVTFVHSPFRNKPLSSRQSERRKSELCLSSAKKSSVPILISSWKINISTWFDKMIISLAKYEIYFYLRSDVLHKLLQRDGLCRVFTDKLTFFLLLQYLNYVESSSSFNFLSGSKLLYEHSVVLWKQRLPNCFLGPQTPVFCISLSGLEKYGFISRGDEQKFITAIYINGK